MITDNNELAQLITLIYSLTGIKLTEHKKTMILRRVTPCMKQLGVTSLTEYCQKVVSSEPLKQDLINAITTNETQFFRTKRIWDFFQSNFLTNWYTENKEKELNIWSCASSSGEEPYSIALLCEEFKKNNPNFLYRITATDIATDELDKAQKGIFSEKAVLGIQSKFPLNIDEYFLKNELNQYFAKSNIKKNICFKQHNLFFPLSSKEQYDLAFLRNVLIYFDKDDQYKVISNVEKNLRKSALLILGESESLNNQLPTLVYQSPLIYKKAG